MKAAKSAVKTVYFSMVTNILLAIVKGVSGFFGNSYALMADAIESITDVFSSFLVLFGIKYASKPADENHPYGHGRAEPLITFFVVGFLIISAGIIAYKSIINIGISHELPAKWTLYVLAVIIIWKELSYRYVLRKGKETKSSSLIADAWHHRSDAITSVAALIGISIALYFGKGYESADDWAALFASGFIVYNSYQIFRPALGEIMDEHLYDDLVEEIRKVSSTVDGIIDTEKCHIRKIGMQYHVDLHATVNAELSVKAGHYLAHNLKDKIQEEIPQISNVLVHVEPSGL